MNDLLGCASCLLCMQQVRYLKEINLIIIADIWTSITGHTHAMVVFKLRVLGYKILAVEVRSGLFYVSNDVGRGIKCTSELDKGLGY